MVELEAPDQVGKEALLSPPHKQLPPLSISETPVPPPCVDFTGTSCLAGPGEREVPCVPGPPLAGSVPTPRPSMALTPQRAQKAPAAPATALQPSAWDGGTAPSTSPLSGLHAQGLTKHL